MNRKEKLKKLKEAGRLKEYAMKIAKHRLIKEGDLYDVDDMLAKLRTDDEEFSDRDPLDDIPDIDDDVWSATTTPEDIADDEAFAYKPEPKMPERPSDIGSEDATVDFGGKKDPNSTVNIRKRPETDDDLADTIDALDVKTREELKARRDSDTIMEGIYVAYDSNGGKITKVKAMNLEDAAEQLSDVDGMEWSEIKDEHGTESITPEEFDSYYEYDMNDVQAPDDDYFMDQEENGEDYQNDDALDSLISDYDEEYQEDDEDDYMDDDIDLNENFVESFDDGLFHHKYRGNITLKEHKQKKTLDSWGKFWSNK